MHNVVIAPHIADELVQYTATFASNHGELCSARFIRSFENAVASLELLPQRGSRRLLFIPEIYRVIPFWKHLWFVYQIDEELQTVYIEYIIDDRSDYRILFE